MEEIVEFAAGIVDFGGAIDLKGDTGGLSSLRSEKPDAMCPQGSAHRKVEGVACCLAQVTIARSVEDFDGAGMCALQSESLKWLI